MGGDMRSEAMYLDFVEAYRAFCRHTGHKLPAAAADSWIVWCGSMRLDLRVLFDALQQHGSLDAKTDLQTWQRVSRSISCRDSCSSNPHQQQLLPVETVKQLFCTHLVDFREYQQVQQLVLDRSCRAKDQRPQRQQQQQIKQQCKKQQTQQHVQVLGPAKPQLKATCGTRPARVARRNITGTVSCDMPVAACAPGRCRSDSTSSRRAKGSPSRKAAAVALRRTGRARVQAVRMGYVTSEVISDDICAASSSDSEDDHADASADSEDQFAEQQPVLLGPAHQAELPQLRPRPAHPTAAEAKFLTMPLYTPAAQQQQGQQQQQQQEGQAQPSLAVLPGHFRGQWTAASSGAARLQLLQQRLQRMDDAMGQGLAERLGLCLLGFKLQAAWSPQEELLFALGMLEQYRMFRHMQSRYLPRRSVHELNGYYYSVWKTRSGQVAEEYALLCEQDGDVVEFRQLLCMRLAAIWDADSMGPIPAAAALPPALAAKLLTKASASRKAAAPAAVAADVAALKPLVPCMQGVSAAAPGSAAGDSSSSPSRLGVGGAPGAAPADSSSPSRSAEQRRSSAGCGSESSWPCIDLLDSDSADEGTGAADEAATASDAHVRKRARLSYDDADELRAAGACGCV